MDHRVASAVRSRVMNDWARLTLSACVGVDRHLDAIATLLWDVHAAEAAGDAEWHEVTVVIHSLSARCRPPLYSPTPDMPA